MKTLTFVVTVAGVLFFPTAWAALPPQQQTPASQPAGQNPQRGRSARDLGAMLMNGLKNTPGCLGVESRSAPGGKNTIFAWFKDKKAVVAWYESDVHKNAKRMFFPEEGDKDGGYVPLAGVPDDAGPLMVIATMTSPKPNAEGVQQEPMFSIETLTPVTSAVSSAPEASFSPPEFIEIFEAKRSAKGGVGN